MLRRRLLYKSEQQPLIEYALRTGLWTSGNGGLYKSTDRWNTWSLVPTIYREENWRYLSMCNSDPNYMAVVATTQDQTQGFGYYTSDGWVTQKRLPSAVLSKIVIEDGNPLNQFALNTIISGEYKRVVVISTSDGWGTYSSKMLDGNFFPEATLYCAVAMCPDNPNKGIAVYSNDSRVSVFYTEDHGITWVPARNLPHDNTVYVTDCAIAGDGKYITISCYVRDYSGTYFGLISSNNGITGLRIIKNGVAPTQPEYVKILRSNPLVQMSGNLRTDDAWATATSMNIYPLAKGLAASRDNPLIQTSAAGGLYGVAYRTTEDGWKTYKDIGLSHIQDVAMYPSAF